MRRGVFALVLAGLPALGGCDGESSFDIGPVDAGAPSPVHHAACLAWATSFCASQEACPARHTAYSQGVCVPRFTLLCEVIASDPDVVFDAGAVAACIQPDAANCDQPAGDLCLPPGRGGVGAPCLSSESCQSGACGFNYSYGQFSPCGSCLAKPCDGGCPSGLRCGLEPDGGIGCVRVLTVGDECDSGNSCGTSYCGPDGMCGALAQLGKPCSGDGTGGRPPCADIDAFCADSDHTCHLVTSAGYGHACVPQVDVQYQCTGFGTCDYTNNVCIPPAADGEFCDEVQGLECAPPAECRDHRCVFPSLDRCSN